jgi:predicted phosphodiesterase
VGKLPKRFYGLFKQRVYTSTELQRMVFFTSVLRQDQFLLTLSQNPFMKIVAIGDIHGRDTWEQIVRSEKDSDLFIFVGDYFDSKEHIPATLQLSNFKNICHLKRQFADKVILLFGNHDWHYMRSSSEHYTGFQARYSTEIAEAVHLALTGHLVQMCCLHDNYLFSHAGITNTWLNNNGYKGEQIDDFVNDSLKLHPNRFRFTPGRNGSAIGDDITQSPIWVRPDSLLTDCPQGYTQVVGHTKQKQITFVENKLILIDTLGTSKQYLVIENGTAIPRAWEHAGKR